MRARNQCAYKPLLASHEVLIPDNDQSEAIVYDEQLMVSLCNGKPIVLDQNAAIHAKQTRTTEVNRETTDES